MNALTHKLERIRAKIRDTRRRLESSRSRLQTKLRTELHDIARRELEHSRQMIDVVVSDLVPVKVTVDKEAVETYFKSLPIKLEFTNKNEVDDVENGSDRSDSDSIDD